MIYTDPHGNRVTPEQATSGGQLRDGYRQRIGPGDHIGFDISLCDSSPSSGSRVFLTDTPAPTAKQRAESARRAWLADKATAYRRQPASNAVTLADARQSRSPSRSIVSRGADEKARQQWLTDKAAAYQRGEG